MSFPKFKKVQSKIPVKIINSRDYKFAEKILAKKSSIFSTLLETDF